MANAVKSRRVTLKAVAQAAKVSLPTASQILNNKANNYCSEEKKRLVRRVAKELNYQPNFGYKVMCGHKTNTIALICSSSVTLAEEHIKDLLLSLMIKFEELGHSVYTSVMTASAKGNIDKINSLISRGCSGFVLLGAPYGSEAIEQIFIQNNLEYINYGLGTKRRVVTDPSYAVKCYIEDLLRTGRDNFKLLTTVGNSSFSRFDGLFQAFPDVKRKQLMDKYISPVEYESFKVHRDINILFNIGYVKTKAVFEADRTLQGIIYHSDYFALGGAKYLTEVGCRIGEDIKLYGYNNVNAVKLAPCPISTAYHDIDKFCKVITRQLFKNGEFEIIINPKVIIK